jgi:aryl-alcohol dehydrogenase-like predicted oxidoreductase
MNLLCKPILDELITACKEQNAGVILGGAFGQNSPFLIRKDRADLVFLEKEGNSRAQNTAKKLRRIYDVADELDVSMTELAIRYILSFDEIHAHVPGAREVAHVRANLESVNKGPLPEGLVKEIDDIQASGESLSIEEIALLGSKMKSR